MGTLGAPYQPSNLTVRRRDLLSFRTTYDGECRPQAVAKLGYARSATTYDGALKPAAVISPAK